MLLSAISSPFSLSTVYFFFLFSSYVHRVLHSFPTRRSSDLADAPRRRGRTRDGTAGKRHHHQRRLGGDRKSTRLNSSHVAISYAVFCLKKKNRISAAFRHTNFLSCVT